MAVIAQAWRPYLFINKIDREGADVARVFAEIRSELTEDVCMITEEDMRTKA